MLAGSARQAIEYRVAGGRDEPAHSLPVAVRHYGDLSYDVPGDHGRDAAAAVRAVRDALADGEAGLPADVPVLAADLRVRVRHRRGGGHRDHLRVRAGLGCVRREDRSDHGPDPGHGGRHRVLRGGGVHRLLHDGTLPLPDRVAGLLLLLYAQSAASIAGLTTGHILDEGAGVRIVLGTAPITLPEPLAGLVRELAATRTGPAAILARMLGIHLPAAVQLQKAASGDWMAYAADLSRRQE